MIRKVQVTNFKSIPELTLELGRVTVLIGANGSGKSNILEAITFAAAAYGNKLDNEFLASRGVRVTETRFMHSAFGEDQTTSKSIKFVVERDNSVEFDCKVWADEDVTYPTWHRTLRVDPELYSIVMGAAKDKNQLAMDAMDSELTRRNSPLLKFLVFAPANSALRTFQTEGQILPLGIRGEGLFAHLKALNTKKHRSRLEKIKESLKLIDWYETFDIPKNLSPGERSIGIRDRFLPEGELFDQRSANEGFLFLLFYTTLFVSPDTPAFFSIDNVDSSLNPKLCIALLEQMVTLAKEYDKQVILTTHNPAILDGLDLTDDEQRLLVVERNKAGHTRVRRVEAPNVTAGQTPVSLSEAFMRGYIGGLPKNF
jgi:predicted ATPase